MATPSSIEGRRATSMLRLALALDGQPEPNRAQRRAAAKRRKKQK